MALICPAGSASGYPSPGVCSGKRRCFCWTRPPPLWTITRLVVTHRLEAALMEQYDEIVVLRDGRVREQGTFSQLMEQKGYFYSLFTLAG